MSQSTPELRKPEEWQSATWVIVSPDGWRHGVDGYPGSKSWDKPITREEYLARESESTGRLT